MLGSDSTETEVKQPKQPGDDTGKLLHTCPNCEEVYLSEQPKQCSACDERTVPVTSDEQVPAK